LLRFNADGIVISFKSIDKSILHASVPPKEDVNFLINLILDAPSLIKIILKNTVIYLKEEIFTYKPPLTPEQQYRLERYMSAEILRDRSIQLSKEEQAYMMDLLQEEQNEPTDDLYQWLKALSLEKYHGQLKEHEVDIKTLPAITSEDLKEMGIDKVGARRKILTNAQNLSKK